MATETTPLNFKTDENTKYPSRSALPYILMACILISSGFVAYYFGVFKLFSGVQHKNNEIGLNYHLQAQTVDNDGDIPLSSDFSTSNCDQANDESDDGIKYC